MSRSFVLLIISGPNLAQSSFSHVRKARKYGALEESEYVPMTEKYDFDLIFHNIPESFLCLSNSACILHKIMIFIKPNLFEIKIFGNLSAAGCIFVYRKYMAINCILSYNHGGYLLTIFCKDE